MGNIVKLRATAVLLLALLGVAACGDDKKPPAASPAPPPWAKVASEQIAEAKKHGVPVAFENDLGMRFVLIPGGTFLMGSPEDEEGRGEDETQHKVTITKSFYMQVTELTNGQYRAFVCNHSSGLAPEQLLDGVQQPVASVSWNDAVAYAKWLEQNDPVRLYRLPTEAEWEYSCRASTTAPFSFGYAITTEEANFDGTFAFGAGQNGIYRDHSVAAGTLGSNRWGLRDMHGNVREWCSDWYGEYVPSTPTDPSGPPSGIERVCRGGTWQGPAFTVRSACRVSADPRLRYYAFGVRLVCPLPEPKSGR